MLDFLHDCGIYVVMIAIIWISAIMFVVGYGIRNTAKNTNVETQQTEAAVENYANEQQLMCDVFGVVLIDNKVMTIAGILSNKMR